MATQTETTSEFSISKNRIASLTPREIAKLNFDEMVQVVISSEISVSHPERISEFEGDTLVRLVYTARSHCRQNHS